MFTTAGTGKVSAVGMIQAVPTGSGYATSSPRRVSTGVCARGVYFTAMRTIVRGLPGTSLVTGS
ncbi:hypothetical protein ACWKSP_28255 [Micromonosporaceae bacterium Da 78-11]